MLRDGGGVDNAVRRAFADRQLDLANGTSHFDPTRAGRGAVKDGTAAPYTVRLR